MMSVGDPAWVSVSNLSTENMLIVRCPNCDTRVVPHANGSCPSCQARLDTLIAEKASNSVESDEHKIAASDADELGHSEYAMWDASNGWREQSLFVSSTFRDFHAERDYLTKVVFPAVAERLKAHKVHFVPVDLRWGVDTASVEDEGGKELHVLSVCFEEIRRSLPFVLVMLGDRFGWVPPDHIVQRAQTADIRARTGASVTSLVDCQQFRSSMRKMARDSWSGINSRISTRSFNSSMS